VTHHITTSACLRTNCAYRDAPHYHFCMSQNKLCVPWRTKLPLLYVSEQTVCTVTHHITTSACLRTNCVYRDAPHYHFSIPQQQISRSSSSKFRKREKRTKAWMSIVDLHKRKCSKLFAAMSFSAQNFRLPPFRTPKEYKLSYEKKAIWPQPVPLEIYKVMWHISSIFARF